MDTLNNDIEKYLRGALTPSERHALEQKALHDPFLAEALEGAQEAGADNFSVDIEMLQRSIKDKSRKRLPKTITLNGWGMYAGIAAGLLLLAVSTYVIFLSIKQQRKQSELAQLEETTDSNAVSKQHAASKNLTDTTFIALNEKSTEIPETKSIERNEPRRESKPSVTKQPHADEITSAETQEMGENKDKVADQTPPSSEKAEQPELTELEKPAEAPVLAKEGGIADDQSAKKSERKRKQDITDARSTQPAVLRSALSDFVVKGTVTGEGAPLPGVNVLIKGTTIGTVTNANGEFLLNVAGGGNQTLVANFIGYQTEEISVGADQELKIELNPDVMQLSEVVVTGYGTTADKPSPDYASEYELAHPIGGRPAFNEYLKTQMQYPKEALENKIEGKVTLQFTVEPSGALTDFKILKGIGYGCDDELIRLVKQGPSWIPSKRNETPTTERIRVRLKFELPK